MAINWISHKNVHLPSDISGFADYAEFKNFVWDKVFLEIVSNFHNYSDLLWDDENDTEIKEDQYSLFSKPKKDKKTNRIPGGYIDKELQNSIIRFYKKLKNTSTEKESSIEIRFLHEKIHITSIGEISILLRDIEYLLLANNAWFIAMIVKSFMFYSGYGNYFGTRNSDSDMTANMLWVAASGFFEAVDLFNPDIWFDLKTYAWERIKCWIRNEIGNNTTSPASAQMIRIAAAFNSVRSQFPNLFEWMSYFDMIAYITENPIEQHIKTLYSSLFFVLKTDFSVIYRYCMKHPWVHSLSDEAASEKFLDFQEKYAKDKDALWDIRATVPSDEHSKSLFITALRIFHSIKWKKDDRFVAWIRSYCVDLEHAGKKSFSLSSFQTSSWEQDTPSLLDSIDCWLDIHGEFCEKHDVSQFVEEFKNQIWFINNDRDKFILFCRSGIFQTRDVIDSFSDYLQHENFTDRFNEKCIESFNSSDESKHFDNVVDIEQIMDTDLFLSFDHIGYILNLSRERIRQIEVFWYKSFAKRIKNPLID